MSAHAIQFRRVDVYLLGTALCRMCKLCAQLFRLESTSLVSVVGTESISRTPIRDEWFRSRPLVSSCRRPLESPSTRHAGPSIRHSGESRNPEGRCRLWQ